MKQFSYKHIAPVFLGLVFFASAGQAKISQQISEKGVAAIVNGDKAEATKQARADAMRRVIERGGGVSVVSQTIVQNFQLVSDQIATNARGVIIDPQWGKPSVKDGIVSVQLTAKVAQDKVADAICAVVKANMDPKVAIVFVEKVGPESEVFATGKGRRGQLEQRLTERFLDGCFTLVETGIPVTATSDGDFEQKFMDQIIKNVNADYVIFGRGYVADAGAVIKEPATGGRPRLHRITAGVDLRLVNLETGEIEVAASDSTNKLGGLTAASLIDKHAKMKEVPKGSGKWEPVFTTEKGCPGSVPGVMDCVTGTIFEKIATNWQNQLVNSDKVAVEVRGVANYALARSFRQGVEKTLKGSKVTQRKLRDGTAYLDVEVEGGADRLAAAIDGKKFGKGRVQVVEVVRGRITLELK